MAVGSGVGLGVVVAVGLGVWTTVSGVGQPKGTGLIEMVGVGEVAGDAGAWITIGVVRGQGAT
ncbi:MAG: hypothetical protein ACREN7_10390, partial [Candidatus Dormibacteria bacterium]